MMSSCYLISINYYIISVLNFYSSLMLRKLLEQ
ncbi:Hypothetical protein FNO222_0307 [Francisella orientalis]|uniref:Uncharacterized protein n=1 Tax=Francisella orientalis TaxID=299583 RepID=A0ABM5U4J2_9GAMM|nr:hypothetical protein FNO12_0305 [Francisella orientalis FNO12]AKN86619.1 Hypothetical protein FNO24_0305 [Francisella orientalis FNO24]AKN88157.1 Hypothetical protein FNO190_0305 [Francisella orientalis]AKU04912.1 Hypothetical protein FNO01_0305 [Francisella orientalis]QEN19821.1 Hypothetical protein FNO39_0307 [Francisella orientalis]